MSSGLLRIWATNCLFTNHIDLKYMYKQDFALNSQQRLIYHKSTNYLNHTKILIFRLFKTGANRSAPDFKRVPTSHFWWLKSANHVKFPEKCVMEKHVLVKKIFTNRFIWTWVKRWSMEWNHTLINKVLDVGIYKEAHADSLLGYERTLHYWFLWNRCSCK